MKAFGPRLVLAATLSLSIGMHLISCSSSTEPGMDAGTAPAAVTDLTVASFTVTGLTPKARYYFALNTIDDQDNSCGCGNCVEVVCFQDAEVAFADPNLAAAVRDQLSLPAGPILRSDLVNLVDLDAYERGISDLGGIEECTYAAFLHLHGNLIDDLTPLAGLAGLGHLGADDNLIADLAPLAGLNALTLLRLERHAISDVAPLRPA